MEAMHGRRTTIKFKTIDTGKLNMTIIGEAVDVLKKA